MTVMDPYGRPKNSQLVVLEQIRDGIGALIEEMGGDAPTPGPKVVTQGPAGEEPWPMEVTNLPISSAPAQGAFPITPSDSEALPETTRAVWVGVEGDLVVTMADNTQVTFQNAYVGWHPISVIAVGAATTAEGIIGVY